MDTFDSIDIKEREKLQKAHAFIVASIRLASDAYRLDPTIKPIEMALSELIKAKHLLKRKV